jgi:DNA segregation ATPase FtsK/SpoIIIE, S-DNA-T family
MAHRRIAPDEVSVHVVVRDAGRDRDVHVGLRNPEATLRDLLHAVLGVDVPESVAIDDRVVPSWTRVVDSGLHEGAVLAPAPDRRGAERSGLELAILSGLDAGRAYPLPVGGASLGRERGNTILLEADTISRRHCELTLDDDGRGTIVDLGSANGTLVDGAAVAPHWSTAVGPGSVIGLGPLHVAVRVTTDDDRPRGLDLRRHVGAAGTIAFNRPPRLAGAAAPPALEPPAEPGEPPKPQFSIASTLGPLVMAIAMVMISGDLRFALFSLLSPLVAIGSYAESRRRGSRKGARARREYEAAVDQLERGVAEARAQELARLRGRCPDAAEVLRRAALPSVRLWERRPEHDDFLHLFAGLGDVTWEPPVAGRADARPQEVAEAVEASALPAAPVAVDLSDGGVVGIVGDRAAALATARSLVSQAAVHHGPADLTIGVFVDEGREPEWEWSKWLPHTRVADGGDENWLSARRDRSEALLRRLGAGAGEGTVLVALDSDLLTEGRNAPARELLRLGAQPDAATPVAGVVISSTRDRLPASCNTVIEISSPDGDAVVRQTEAGGDGQQVLLAGISVDSARRCARDLARFEDPELRQAGAGLPDNVRLLPLLELDGVNAEAIRARWGRARADARAAAPVGVTEHGTFTLDLERDGPHGLVGGTTGSGKSELLRSVIAALAANADPRHLTFLLMDFKGGAAFDACARLPHTVGMVTDLDEDLVERALRALDAELQHRERLLRAAGADNLRAYHEREHDEPLPRLVVVIDEFAKMARELPELLTALVDVAQRGRTLGVHLILATQRPAGVVNDHIRTNTNLRIALRVQDAADSTDVIGERAAAELSRHRPGRAYVRLGPDEVVPIQSALITCATDAESDAPAEVAPFVFGAAPRDRDPRTGEVPVPSERPSDLARLVDAIIEANAAEGIAPPRRPWPEPLPERIDLAALATAEDDPRAPVALADEPQRQTQYPVGWDLAEGNLLLLGIAGSGTTTALASLAVSLAGSRPPEQLELYALDYGAGELAALEALPHVGSVILAGDRERQLRLLRNLRRELDERRAGERRAATVVLIDNLAAMRAEFDDVAGLDVMDELTRVYADGPQVGIHMAVTADRPNIVPGAWTAVTTQKWLFRLPDPYDYVSLGLDRKDVPRATPGRAVTAERGVQIQVAQATPSFEAVAAGVAERYAGATPVARPIRALPTEVSLEAVARVHEEPWRIPVGVRETDLGVAELALYEGEHAIVTAPARSGKSLALWTIAESLADNGVRIFAVGGRRSPLHECPALERFATAGGDATALLAELRAADGPLLVLVDDAEDFDDSDGAIAGLLAAGRADVHVVAAARADSLRSLYGHWTQDIRRSKAGLLLRPDIDLDGDLVGVTLPRRAPVQMTAGRGYLSHGGQLELVQVALPRPAELATEGASWTR